MTSYRRGDVVLIPFPFTDLSTVKQRPALIVSSDAFNSANPDVIAVGITSKVSVYRDEPGTYLIVGSEQILTGLPKESVVRAGKILSIDQRLVRRLLGVLPTHSVNKVVSEITVIIR